MKEGLTKAQETLRQRLRDRLTGRKGLLAELKNGLAMANGASEMQPYSFGLQYVLYHNAVNIHSESISLAENKNQDREAWIKMVLDVAKIVKRHSEEFINDTAKEIEDLAKVLVPQEILERVLCVQELADHWAWPASRNIAHGALSVLVASNQWLSDTRLFYEWPLGVTSTELWTWAGSKIEKLSPESASSLKFTLKRRDETLAESKPRFFPFGLPWGMPWGTESTKAIPLPALAWLYYAEQTARSVLPAAPTGCPLDVQAPAVRVTSALGGAHPGALWNGSEVRTAKAYEDTPSSVRFKWADGEVEQLDLFVDTDGISNPLLAVARKYGQAAVRDLLGIYLLTFARSASADELIWWWPDEHLEAMGRKPTKDNKEELIRRMDAMQRTRLEVQYPKGRPLKGPLVAFTATDTVARQIKLHPALYKGIKHEDGSLGTWWWWGPLELLAMPADRGAGRVHTFAVATGHFWRSSLRDGEIKPARVSAARLVDYLGIRGRAGEEGKHYTTDTNAARTLQTTLEAAKEAGSLGQWEIDHGRLEDLSAVLVLRPSAEALELIKGTRRIERPAFLPATGTELTSWLQRNDWSATEAGERIGVAGSTMRRSAAYGVRPLPDNVRRALRRYLWPGFGS